MLIRRLLLFFFFELSLLDSITVLPIFFLFFLLLVKPQKERKGNGRERSVFVSKLLYGDCRPSTTASAFTSAAQSAYYDNTEALPHPPGSRLGREKRQGTHLQMSLCADCLQVLRRRPRPREMCVPGRVFVFANAGAKKENENSIAPSCFGPHSLAIWLLFLYKREH